VNRRKRAEAEEIIERAIRIPGACDQNTPRAIPIPSPLAIK